MRLALLVTILLVAIELPTAAGQSELKVDIDQASFAYDANNSLVEIYMAFEASSLPFRSEDSVMVAQLPVVYQMRRSTSASLDGTPLEPVWTDTSSISFVVADTSLLVDGQHFLFQSRAAIPPGEYELGISFPPGPGDNRVELEVTREVVVPDFASTEVASLSEITLASSIARSDDKASSFYKHGLDIRPNANQLYGGTLSQLYYYAEVYSVDASAGSSSEYTVLSYLAEANRPQPMADFEKRAQRAVRSPDVLVGSFDLSQLPSGSYFLRLVVLGPSNEALVERSRKFFVYNPSVEREVVVAEATSFEASEFASLSDEDIEDSFKRISMIATDRERRRIRSIEDADERRRFLYDFWLIRDPNPDTRDNEFRDEFFRRVQYANERYTTSFREGWESDRGRVIVRHGMPSNVEPHLYDRETAPYEIWQYNNIPGEGQGIFIFADTQGFGAFELLHSTVSGERQNPAWLSELRRR